MSDEELKVYLPKFGDRIAISSFVKSMEVTDADKNTSPASDRKRPLVEKLMKKVKMDRNEHQRRSCRQKGNKNACRPDRRVALGWLDYDMQLKDYKQVKGPGGGGTRYELFSNDMTLTDVLQRAKKLFFPSDDSRRGKVDEFNFYITDATRVKFDETTTVDDCYDRSKARPLRMYLASTKKLFAFVENSSSSTPSSSITRAIELDSPQIRTDYVKQKKAEEVRPIAESSPVEPSLISVDETLSATQSCEQILYEDKSAMGHQSECVLLSDDSDLEIQFGKINNSDFLEQTVFYQPPNPLSMEGQDINQFTPPEPSCTVQVESSGETTTDNFLEPLAGSVTDTLSMILPPRSPTPPCDYHVISIHRAKLQEEMVRIFMDPAIIEAKIRFRFVDEAGSDAQGLSREAYSAFWKNFMLTSSCGENERVPALFPDYGQGEWQSVGRILLKGYQESSIYPLELSFAFSVAIIYSETELSGDILLESLRMFLPSTDRKVIDKALSGITLDADDNDDFIDLLSRVNCHTIPSKDELLPVIISIAHKELIQEAKYALDAIAHSSRNGLNQLLPNIALLRDLYERKKPTARKIIKLLQSYPVGMEQTSALSYLKQFIKGLDDDERMLKKFLRHFTGAEVICTDQIQVTFNRMRGCGRAPQAHTCGPLIELPCTYSSYPELRSELISILDANYMQMDII